MSRLVLRKVTKAFMGYRAGAVIQLTAEDAEKLEAQGLVTPLKAKKSA